MFEYWVFIMRISKPKVFAHSQQVSWKHLSMNLMLHSTWNLTIRNQSKTHSYLHIYYNEGAILFVHSDSINEYYLCVWWRTSHPFNHVNEENIEVYGDFRTKLSHSASYLYILQGLFRFNLVSILANSVSLSSNQFDDNSI